VNEHAASAAASLDRPPEPAPVAEDAPPSPPSRGRLRALLAFQVFLAAGAVWTVLTDGHPVASMHQLFWLAAVVVWLATARGTLRRLRAAVPV
jgi:hypothetical protein